MEDSLTSGNHLKFSEIAFCENVTAKITDFSEDSASFTTLSLSGAKVGVPSGNYVNASIPKDQLNNISFLARNSVAVSPAFDQCTKRCTPRKGTSPGCAVGSCGGRTRPLVARVTRSVAIGAQRSQAVDVRGAGSGGAGRLGARARSGGRRSSDARAGRVVDAAAEGPRMWRCAQIFCGEFQSLCTWDLWLDIQQDT